MDDTYLKLCLHTYLATYISIHIGLPKRLVFHGNGLKQNPAANVDVGGFQVNAKSHGGSTALLMASANGHLEIVRSLARSKPVVRCSCLIWAGDVSGK